MMIMQELFQKVAIEEAVRRGVRVSFPQARGRTILGVGCVRDLGHDFAQVALERGQVKRELGVRFDDDADATGGSKEE